MNVYSLVTNFIIPWTRGSGVGYALLVNQHVPKEVNHMISHAWFENTEEFFETLLQTFEDGDVLFVCALSLFQAEDGSGPSIAEQLGTDPRDSPFRQVLDHISSNQNSSTCSLSMLNMIWRVSAFFGMLAYWSPIVIWGCIPSWTHCAVPKFHVGRISFIPTMGALAEQAVIDRFVWHKMQPGSCFAIFVPLSIALGIATMVSKMLIKSKAVYCGSMVVVPNRQCDFHSRLWCVYEVFVAMKLGVRIRHARTLASAGRVSTEVAQCSSSQDAERIRSEILSDHSFKEVDRVVFVVTRYTRWYIVRTILVQCTCISLFFTAWFHLLLQDNFPPMLTVLGFSLGVWMACLMFLSLLYVWCKGTKGVLMFWLAFLVAGILQLEALLVCVFQPLQPLFEVDRSLISAGFFEVVGTSGPCFMSTLVVAKCCGRVAFVGRVAIGAGLAVLQVWALLHAGGNPYFTFSCGYGEDPYACSAWSLTLIAPYVVQVFVLLEAERQWGILFS